jgi:hypothetical protein
MLLINDPLAMVPDRHSRRFYHASLTELAYSSRDACLSDRSLRLGVVMMSTSAHIITVSSSLMNPCRHFTSHVMPVRRLIKRRSTGQGTNRRRWLWGCRSGQRSNCHLKLLHFSSAKSSCDSSIIFARTSHPQPGIRAHFLSFPQITMET